MPVTVSDSSTLIHLAGIGRLDLLRRFYGTLWIPPAVFREVVLRAKQEAIIPSLGIELERLRRETGFYLHDELSQRVLLLAGEAT